MPSFDIVSKIDKHEASNAVDQANREVKNRFDFKDTNSHFELVEDVITVVAPNKFQLQQMQQILEPKLVKRGIDLNCLVYEDVHESLHEATQKVTIKHGIDHEFGKKINKLIKESQIKVQSSIMGDHIRIVGKKRDDLQEVMALLRKEQLGIPLQFENLRD
ncbi:MAG TPA: YajQ family cyclic di-GMP-binding protein [Coxiellaceae bacterium]|nr:YajQ family cyclic di-GMP-binding protein [Coxiellaceae bacterium]